MAENLKLSLLCRETIVVDAEKDMTVDKTPISQMGCFQSECEEEIIREMVEKEKEHLPSDDYVKRLRSGDFDLSIRRSEALNWIWKACEEHQFGPLCFCLSVNYFDRFLSVHDLSSGKGWILQLLAVACLSLAAKIEETEVPMLRDLQVGDPQFVFEAKSVQRMELLILNRLKWRLRSIIPCSYISYFLRKMSKCDQEPSSALISRSLQVIANTTKGIDFLEFKPSEVAAAVAHSVSGEVNLDNSSFSPLFSLLQKERVKKIGEMIERDGSGLCSQTPSGVLESCFSFKTLDSSSSSTTQTYLS